MKKKEVLDQDVLHLLEGMNKMRENPILIQKGNENEDVKGKNGDKCDQNDFGGQNDDWDPENHAK